MPRYVVRYRWGAVSGLKAFEAATEREALGRAEDAVRATHLAPLNGDDLMLDIALAHLTDEEWQARRQAFLIGE